ncbi:UDP-2,3-diacylglucosamine diphosphatase [Spirobacillus cienkowskii]|uniref:UDP-2,3-diacylglucosamine diphosphatase n=1 Tax=Spirobacillus cienkowskii TaxID=495820 RepID=UPI0030CCCA1C
MKTIKLQIINNFIVISDVHLRNPKDENTKIFIETLDQIIVENYKNKIDALFLLGDIFDFIAASKNYFLNFWKEIFDKFAQIKQLGMQIYFIEGNHDFGFEHFKSKTLNHYFTDYGDFIIEFEHKIFGLVVLRHGDNVVCSNSYHKVRAILKSSYFQKLINFLLPGFIMHFICISYAKKSRKKGEYNKLQPSFLKHCIENYTNEYKTNFNKKIDTLFLGHIHVFLDTSLNNSRFIVGPDWHSAPNYFICTDHNLQRIFVKSDKQILKPNSLLEN